jgi:kynurenine formamidase
VAKKIRGVSFEENNNNSMGLEFYNLSHRFGYQSPNWPYFEDVKIERIHYHAKSGVLSQRITTSMHNTTHIDAPAHVVQGTPFIDEVPLPHFFGSGIVVSIPKKKWEPITYDVAEFLTPVMPATNKRLAAGWMVRIVFSLCAVPAPDDALEETVRFVLQPMLGGGGGEAPR